MISIYSYIETPYTTLKKINKNIWEFTITSSYDEKNPNFENTCTKILKENSLMNRETIEEWIKQLKKTSKK